MSTAADKVTSCFFQL